MHHRQDLSEPDDEGGQNRSCPTSQSSHYAYRYGQDQYVVTGLDHNVPQRQEHHGRHPGEKGPQRHGNNSHAIGINAQSHGRPFVLGHTSERETDAGKMDKQPQTGHKYGSYAHNDQSLIVHGDFEYIHAPFHKGWEHVGSSFEPPHRSPSRITRPMA